MNASNSSAAQDPLAMVKGLFAQLADNRDLALAGGVVAIIAMLILPMPGWMLDMCLAISITLSVLILMTSLFIEKPLELSAFPTILLIATMLRLGLNLASTRLILGHGHEGTHAAGNVIAAFGEFLMGGETVIGITIFLILVIINFIVITKGAGRIAEVAARFSLDSMPGKQMAIDADLNAGMIDEPTARARRAELEAESGFYGAMDGASKFVKGDAVAGLIITGVNIVVGLIVGIGSHGVDFSTAFNSYTILTVGDGLVSQIPALIVSTAAGLLVSKGGMRGKAGKALGEQLGRYPKAFGMASALLTGLALMPGLPFIPFAVLAGATGWAAWQGMKREKAAEAAKQVETQQAEQAETKREEPISNTLAIDPIRVEIGYALLPLVNNDGDDVRLDEQVKALRRQMASDFGFVLPPVRILDNMALGPNEYVVRIRETEVGRGQAEPDRLLVINPTGGEIGLPGTPTTEPVFNLPAVWIARDMRDEAGFRGLTAVDAGTVITTHVTELVKDNISELLTYSETQKLLSDVHKDAEKLIADIVPAKISISGLQRILQNLLSEGISIRDLPSILEGVAEAAGAGQNLMQMTETVRGRLARQISSQHAGPDGIPVVTLSSEWDRNFTEALISDGEQVQLGMAPSMLQKFVADLRRTLDQQAERGEVPCLLVSPVLRPFIRSVIERVRPSTVVLSQNEIHIRARIKALGQIGERTEAPGLSYNEG